MLISRSTFLPLLLLYHYCLFRRLKDIFLQASEEHVVVNEGAKILPPETSTDLTMANDKTEITDGGMVGPACPQNNGSSIAGSDRNKNRFSFEQPIANGPSMYARESLAISGQSGEINACTVMPPSAKIVSC